MNWKSLKEVDRFEYLGSTQTKGGKSIKEVKIRLVQTYSAMTKADSAMEKQSYSVFTRRLNHSDQLPCHYCSTDVRAGHWRQISRDEFKPFKTNATGRCLAYHTENIKRKNVYGNRLISSPDARSCYCRPSSIARNHGSDMSVVMIRCRQSYFKEQWMVAVA